MQNVLPGCLLLRSLASSFAVLSGLSSFGQLACLIAHLLAGWLACMLAFHSNCDPKPAESEHLVLAPCSRVVLSVAAPRAALANLGDTCYMNSVVQVLLHTELLGPHIASHASDPACPAGCLACMLKLTQMKTEDVHAGAKTAPEWSKFISRLGLTFQSQQDATQVFSEVLTDLERAGAVRRLLGQQWRSSMTETPSCGCREPSTDDTTPEQCSIMALSLLLEHGCWQLCCVTTAPRSTFPHAHPKPSFLRRFSSVSALMQRRPTVTTHRGMC